MAIFFAIICYFCWASGDAVGVAAVRRLDPYSATFWSMALSTLMFLTLIPWQWANLAGLTLSGLILNLVLGILLIAGIITYCEGVKTDNAAVVGTISAAFIAVTVILSLIFFHEKISAAQAAAIIVIFFGLGVMSIDWQTFKNLTWDRSVKLALFSMVTWGVYFAFIKIPIRQVGWFWPNCFTFALFPLLYIYIRFRGMKLQRPTAANRAFLPLIGTAVLSRTAEMSYNLAISQGLTSIVAPIAGSYPTLFVLLAAWWFKDPFKKHQLVGIIIILSGIVGLAFATK
ncbi:MAG: DMT family transporter [Patescibacteria group bacterium]|jgi:drug/metabolite transporter (DMT)-like permease